MNRNKDDQENFSLPALQAGDRHEFARLVEEYSPRIYRLALKMLDDPSDAEDVLQETFLKAYRSLPAFEGRSSLSTWLYRIAANEALMALRRRKPEQPLAGPDEQDDGDISEPQIVDWCCLPEEEMLSTESRQFLDQAISKLPESLRVVFVLRDVQSLSIRETAEILSLTEMAVKTRLLRARLRLRDELSGYYRERLAEKYQK